jgi:catechol 2,3-dioxygenase-like lactoylglutathione lyase family enzyme
MSILGVRVELFVNDVERSARFYREVLGFRPARDVDETGYLPISSGALTIGLQGHANLPSDHHFRPEHFGGPRGVGVEIQIEVDDVDALYALAVTTAPVGLEELAMAYLREPGAGALPGPARGRAAHPTEVTK